MKAADRMLEHPPTRDPGESSPPASCSPRITPSDRIEWAFVPELSLDIFAYPPDLVRNFSVSSLRTSITQSINPQT